MLESYDVGLYVNVLLRMSDEWIPSRQLMLHSPAARLIVECMLKPAKYALSPPGLPYSFDPRAMQQAQEDMSPKKKKQEEGKALDRRKGLWHTEGRREAASAKDLARHVAGVGSGKDGMQGFIRESSQRSQPAPVECVEDGKHTYPPRGLWVFKAVLRTLLETLFHGHSQSPRRSCAPGLAIGAQRYLLFMASHLVMNMVWPPQVMLTPEQEAAMSPGRVGTGRVDGSLRACGKRLRNI